MYIDYLGWTMDFTVMQMVTTFKLCSYALVMADGHAKNKDHYYDFQKANMIERTPSILEFYSYIFYWCTYLAGPFFEFNEYISFIDRSMFKATKGEIPPGSLKACLSECCLSAFASSLSCP